MTSDCLSSDGKSVIGYTPRGRNWVWKNCSSAGTMVSMCNAMLTPLTSPSSIPINPIRVPCTMNTHITEAGDMPSVRRIAMSACLSVTTMTSVDTILNAATATISERMMNMTVFSVRTALK